LGLVDRSSIGPDDSLIPPGLGDYSGSAAAPATRLSGDLGRNQP